MNESYKSKGFTHFINAFGFSLQGLRSAFVEEAAFRHQLSALVILLPAAFWFDVTTVERVILIGVLFLVLIIELLNSAIEAVVDRIGMERHELSGRAKDLGSAAVFMAMMLVLFAWGMILLA